MGGEGRGGREGGREREREGVRGTPHKKRCAQYRKGGGREGGKVGGREGGRKGEREREGGMGGEGRREGGREGREGGREGGRECNLSDTKEEETVYFKILCTWNEAIMLIFLLIMLFPNAPYSV